MDAVMPGILYQAHCFDRHTYIIYEKDNNKKRAANSGEKQWARDNVRNYHDLHSGNIIPCQQLQPAVFEPFIEAI
jgi:hypothetical protein